MTGSSRINLRFIQDARERMDLISDFAFDLEQGRRDPESSHEARLAMHSLKGAAGFLGLEQLTNDLHQLEELVGDPASTPAPPPDSESQVGLVVGMVHRILKQIEDLEKTVISTQQGGQKATHVSVSEPAPQSGGPQRITLRFDITRLDSLTQEIAGLRQEVGDLQIAHSQLANRIRKHRHFEELASRAARELGRVIVDPGRIEIADDISNLAERAGDIRSTTQWVEARHLLGDLTSFSKKYRRQEERTTCQLDRIAGTLDLADDCHSETARITDLIGTSVRNLERQIGDIDLKLQDLRMVTTGQIFGRFRRQARELASRLGKDVDIVIREPDAEVDGAHMDILAEPVLHILRNAIDHGIENPNDREWEAKPPRGTITISTRHRPGWIQIDIEDDGRGIEPARIRSRLESQGLVDRTKLESLTTDELTDWIFHPGFSTRDTANDISGRGVGMDVVKCRIEKAGGSIRITSTPGKGTTMHISLPAGLGTLEAVIVRQGSHTFGFPLRTLYGVIPDLGMVAWDTGQGPRVFWRGIEVPIQPLTRFADSLFKSDSRPHQEQPKARSVVPTGLLIGGSWPPSLCLSVDRLIGRRHLVFRSETVDPVGGSEVILGQAKLDSDSDIWVLDTVGLIDLMS